MQAYAKFGRFGEIWHRQTKHNLSPLLFSPLFSVVDAQSDDRTWKHAHRRGEPSELLRPNTVRKDPDRKSHQTTSLHRAPVSTRPRPPGTPRRLARDAMPTARIAGSRVGRRAVPCFPHSQRTPAWSPLCRTARGGQQTLPRWYRSMVTALVIPTLDK